MNYRMIRSVPFKVHTFKFNLCSMYLIGFFVLSTRVHAQVKARAEFAQAGNIAHKRYRAYIRHEDADPNVNPDTDPEGYKDTGRMWGESSAPKSGTYQVAAPSRLTLNFTWSDTSDYVEDLDDAGAVTAIHALPVDENTPYDITLQSTGVGILFGTRNVKTPSTTGPNAEAPTLTFESRMRGGFIQSNNVYVFITEAWDGQPFSINATCHDKSGIPEGAQGTVADPDHIKTWNFISAPYLPDRMTTLLPPISNRLEGEERTELNNWWYHVEPNDPPAPQPPGTPPFYQNVLVDEQFDDPIARFEPADLSPQGQTAVGGLTDKDAIAKFFFINATIILNTSFTVNAEDRINDPHGGNYGPAEVANWKPESIADNKIGFARKQTYTAGPKDIGYFKVEFFIAPTGDAQGNHAQLVSKVRAGTGPIQ